MHSEWQRNSCPHRPYLGEIYQKSMILPPLHIFPICLLFCFCCHFHHLLHGSQLVFRILWYPSPWPKSIILNVVREICSKSESISLVLNSVPAPIHGSSWHAAFPPYCSIKSSLAPPASSSIYSLKFSHTESLSAFLTFHTDAYLSALPQLCSCLSPSSGRNKIFPLKCCRDIMISCKKRWSRAYSNVSLGVLFGTYTLVEKERYKR